MFIPRLVLFTLLSLTVPVAATAKPRQGQYSLSSEPGVRLQLDEDQYHVWFEEGGEAYEVQSGTYTVDGDRIHFSPEINNLPDMGESDGRALDRCRIQWMEGTFVNKACGKRKTSSAGRRAEAEKGKGEAAGPARRASASWHVIREKGVEISVPKGARVEVRKDGVKVAWRKGVAGLQVLEGRGQGRLGALVKACAPVKRMRKGELHFALCGHNSRYRYLESVTKGESPRIVSFSAADDFDTLKKLSVAIASIRPAAGRRGANHRVKLTRWRPADGSYSIEKPKGWNADGGTADFGRNGYIRIVKVEDPEGKRGLVGVYYPFMQYAQLGYTSNGNPPMEPRDYVENRFFQDLAANYDITFDDVRILHFKIDDSLSRQLTSTSQELYANYGITGSIEYKAFLGEGAFTKDGEERRMAVGGVMSYLTMPLMGASSYVWGPAPILVAYAPDGELASWYPTFQEIGNSWQVDPSWLSAHLRYAGQDARQQLAHYRKISGLIRKHEESMNQQMEEWEHQQHFENELFWDRFYALGGEDRYDHPQTGEEIDVPTGADKYLYDNYSQGWIGIHMDQPDAADLVNELKNNGFVELVPHEY